MHRREDFEIAIICALPLEYDAVSSFLMKSGKTIGENNICKTGRIGAHNVVLALLSGMGKASAASTAASIRSSYRHIRLGLLVGVCGGVPQPGGEEILLGDVVISKRHRPIRLWQTISRQVHAQGWRRKQHGEAGKIRPQSTGHV